MLSHLFKPIPCPDLRAGMAARLEVGVATNSERPGPGADPLFRGTLLETVKLAVRCGSTLSAAAGPVAGRLLLGRGAQEVADTHRPP
jgi:hypothetical protein